MNKNSSQNFWNFIFTVLYLILALSLTFCLRSQGRIIKEISVFDFFLLSLATFRLIRLFTYDSVTGYIREYFGKFSDGPGKVMHSLLDCPWCTGVWMALVVAFIYYVLPDLWLLLLILALAGLGSLIQIIIWKIGLEPGEKRK